MTNKVNKTAIFILVFVLISLIAFSGCAKEAEIKETVENESTQTKEAESTNAPEETAEQNENFFPIKDKITLSIMTRSMERDRDTYADLEVQRLIGNVEFVWDLVPNSDWETKQSVVLASGNVPDIMLLNADDCTNIFNQFGSQGIFANLYPMYESGELPYFSQLAESYPHMLSTFITKDNVMHGFVMVNTIGQVDMGYFIREDIYQKHDLEIPTTFDELYESLKILKGIYPDSLPIVNRSGPNNLIEAILRAYHSSGDIYYDNNTLAYEYGPATSNYKDGISYLAKLYADGLIDPEFATTSTAQWLERMTTGQGFFCFTYFERLDQIQDAVVATDPDTDFSVIGILPPQADDHVGKSLRLDDPVQRSWALVVGANSDYIETAAKIIDYATYSDEISDVINWGIEGDTYNIVDGVKVFADDIKTPSNPGGTRELGDLGIDGRSGLSIGPCDYRAWYAGIFGPRANAATILHNDNIDTVCYFNGYSLSFTQAQSDEIAALRGPLTTYVDESVLKFITGQWNMDSDWDTFQENLVKFKYGELLQYYLDAYDELPEDQKGLMVIKNKD